MIPSKGAMKAALLHMEKELNKRGWDLPPFLGFLIAMRLRSGIGLATMPFPVQPTEISNEPGQAVAWIGGMIRSHDGPDKPMPEHLDPEEFCGVLFAGEGWTQDMPPDERDGRRLADIPGSKEIRFIHVIDTAGRYYMVNRIRGQKPEALVVEKGTADDNGDRMMLRGNIAIGLRDILIGLGRNLPLGSMDLDAIAAIGAEDDPTERFL